MSKYVRETAGGRFSLCKDKFYEGKAGIGILYIFTFGLFGIGVIVDFITILLKPNPYYVEFRFLGKDGCGTEAVFTFRV